MYRLTQFFVLRYDVLQIFVLTFDGFFGVYILFASQNFLPIFIVGKRGDPIANFICICI